MSLENPYCLVADLQKETGNSDATLTEWYEDCINAASRYIDEYCQRDFLPHDYSTTAYQVKRSEVMGNLIVLPWPIIYISEITLGGVVLDSTTYVVDGRSVELLAGDWQKPEPSCLLEIKGEFGYAAYDQNLPAQTFDGNNPNHPTMLTVSGTLEGYDDGPLTTPMILSSISQLNSYLRWKTIDSYVFVYHENSDWLIVVGAQDYVARKASVALTPVGLTDWSLDSGTGQPEITGNNPVGRYTGDRCRAGSAPYTWWWWQGSSWVEGEGNTLLTCPTRIKRACVKIAAAWSHEKRRERMDSEGKRTNLLDEQVPDDALKLLARYKPITF